VTKTAVAANVHKTLDVSLDFRPQITFHLILIRDEVGDGTDVLVGPVNHLGVVVNAGRIQNLGGERSTYAKDVSQTDNAAFITREVYTCNSCHNYLLLSLALTLLELGVLFVNNVHLALTADDLAIDGALFDGGSNLHNGEILLAFRQLNKKTTCNGK
jgi:hypothetical protein